MFGSDFKFALVLAHSYVIFPYNLLFAPRKWLLDSLAS